MTTFKPKPGESLVIETPLGPVTIKMLAGEQIGVEVPAGFQIKASSTQQDWLPTRPDIRRKAA